MPKTTTMSKRDIAQRAASRKAPSVKTVAKRAAKAPAKPAKAAVATAKPVPAPKAAAASAKPATGGVQTATGAKMQIITMIAAKGGTSAAEVCKALGWARAGATIGRAIKLAGFKVAKVRDADGVLRYSRAN